jgi:hypothetical protein
MHCPPEDPLRSSFSTSFLHLALGNNYLYCLGLPTGWLSAALQHTVSQSRSSTDPRNSCRWNCGQWCPSTWDALQPASPAESAPNIPNKLLCSRVTRSVPFTAGAIVTHTFRLPDSGSTFWQWAHALETRSSTVYAPDTPESSAAFPSPICPITGQIWCQPATQGNPFPFKIFCAMGSVFLEISQILIYR